MFRRVELITEIRDEEYEALLRIIEQQNNLSDDAKDLMRFHKSGLVGFGNETIWDAWVDMPNPRRDIYKNCRFYFTEAGWRKYGRATITACQQTGQRYRVLSIKEDSVDVVYRDDVQVAVRPRRKRATRVDVDEA